MRPFDIHNKKHLAMGAAALFSTIVALSIGVKLMTNRDHEEALQREWYSKQLRYAFGAKVDTVITLKQRWGYGEIYFVDQESRLGLAIEDSLGTAMVNKIRFITRESDGRFKFAIQDSERYLTGDSLYVNSSKNQILFFRDGKLISTHKISSSLTDSWFY